MTTRRRSATGVKSVLLLLSVLVLQDDADWQDLDSSNSDREVFDKIKF